MVCLSAPYPSGKASSAGIGGTSTARKRGNRMEVDLHGWHSTEIVNTGALQEIVRQAWEMGERCLTLIHGHGRRHDLPGRFVNTNTGRFGILVRAALREDKSLRRWIQYTTIDSHEWGATSIKLRRNPSPSRAALNPKAWAALAKGPEGRDP